MTNNQSPDMPDEIFVFRNATLDLVCYDGHQSCGADFIYRRADLIKPEPVADFYNATTEEALSVIESCLSGKEGLPMGVINAAIKQVRLNGQGHLRPAVPREVIEKAYEALVFADAATVRIDTDEYRFCDVTFNKIRNALTEIAPYVQKA